MLLLHTLQYSTSSQSCNDKRYNNPCLFFFSFFTCSFLPKTSNPRFSYTDKHRLSHKIKKKKSHYDSGIRISDSFAANECGSSSQRRQKSLQFYLPRSEFILERGGTTARVSGYVCGACFLIMEGGLAEQFRDSPL